MALMTWVIAVGGPLLGIAAIVALVVAHEHGSSLRRAKLPVLARVPSAPHAGRRAATTLLDDYLVEDREANPTQLRHSHTGLVLQASRSDTWVLDEYLEDRQSAAAAVAVAPAPIPVRVGPRRIEERAAHPTRLVPLGAQAEIAIG
jgi:hypothetical protein